MKFVGKKIELTKLCDIAKSNNFNSDLNSAIWICFAVEASLFEGLASGQMPNEEF